MYSHGREGFGNAYGILVSFLRVGYLRASGGVCKSEEAKDHWCTYRASV